MASPAIKNTMPTSADLLSPPQAPPPSTKENRPGPAFRSTSLDLPGLQSKQRGFCVATSPTRRASFGVCQTPGVRPGASSNAIEKMSLSPVARAVGRMLIEAITGQTVRTLQSSRANDDAHPSGTPLAKAMTRILEVVTDALPDVYSALMEHASREDGGRSSAPKNPAETLATVAPIETNTANSVVQWAKGVGVAVGHRAVAAGLASAIQEATNIGVDTILHSTDTGDQTKMALAKTLMRSVIAANIGAAAYRMHAGSGMRWRSAGNAAQSRSIAATMISALKNGTIKDPPPSLAKLGAHAATLEGRSSFSSLIVQLGNNLRQDAHPLVAQLIDSALRSADQFMLDKAPERQGVPENANANGSDRNTSTTKEARSASIKDNAKQLLLSVAANAAGDALDTVVPALIQYRLQHGSFDGIGDIDFRVNANSPMKPKMGEVVQTILDAVIPPASRFDSVRAGSMPSDPVTDPQTPDEVGNTRLDNYTTALMIATLCVPLLTKSSNPRRPLAAVDGS